LNDATTLLYKAEPFGWHGEVHIDADLLDLVERLSLPEGMPLVIDDGVVVIPHAGVTIVLEAAEDMPSENRRSANAWQPVSSVWTSR
jgi:hypothetical protein